MASRKRAREADLLMKVASGEALHAESCVLRSLSDSARGLPAAAEEWDVSGLLAQDGQPFSPETVSCWLACAYSLLDGLGELEQQHLEQLSTAAGLAHVLAFADAVGSGVGLLNAACSQLQRLKFVVQLPEQTLELPVADSCYYFELVDHDAVELVRSTLRDSSASPRLSLHAEPSEQLDEFRAVQQQVTKQLAALLHSAHTLRLQPLLDVLHHFILLNCNAGWRGELRLLCGVMGDVFRDAVLDAALGGTAAALRGTLSREAYISSALSQPCSLTPGVAGSSRLLQPVGPTSVDASSRVLTFDAQLLRDFVGGRTGDTVKVTLDLFGTTGRRSGGSMTLKLVSEGRARTVELPAQLLLGHTVSDAAALEAFLKNAR